MGQVQSKLEVNPVQLAMGDIKAGESVEQRFVLRGAKPFKVTEVEAQNMEVQFEPSEEAKAVHLLIVRLAPDPMRATGTSSITFKTDMENDAAVTSNLTYKIVTQSTTGTVEPAKPLASLP